MSLNQLRSLQVDRTSRLATELGAVAHAIAPIASDFASTALFYAMLAAGVGVRASIALGIAIGLTQFVFRLLRQRRTSAFQVASIALIVLVGTLTLLTNDARIIFWKISLIYFVLGCSMLRTGWVGRHVPPIALDHLSARELVPWERAWAGLMFLTAGFDLSLSLSVSPRTAAIAFGVSALVSKVVLFTAQYLILRGRARRSILARIEAAATA